MIILFFLCLNDLLPMFNDKWNRRFLDECDNIRQWSKDPSTKVGAVIIRPDLTMASYGYNGFARGVKDKEKRYLDRALKYKLVLHAEENAILNAREVLEGYTLFVRPLSPCSLCAARIIQYGIKYVVTTYHDRMKDDSHELAFTQFDEAGVKYKVYFHESTKT